MTQENEDDVVDMDELVNKEVELEVEKDVIPSKDDGLAPDYIPEDTVPDPSTVEPRTGNGSLD